MYKAETVALKSFTEASDKAFGDRIAGAFRALHPDADSNAVAEVEELAIGMLQIQGYNLGVLRNKDAAGISVEYIKNGFDAVCREYELSSSVNDAGRETYDEAVESAVMDALDEYGGILHERTAAKAEDYRQTCLI